MVGQHPIQPTALFGSHFFFLLPTAVYEDKDKTDYEDAKEPRGFAFVSVQEFKNVMHFINLKHKR